MFENCRAYNQIDTKECGMKSEVLPKVDTELLGGMLLGKWAEARRRTRAICEKPEMWQIPGLSHHEHRERVLGQLHILVDEGVTVYGFPKIIGGDADPGGSLTVFEELVFADPSLQIKYGVQWGLFGAAILYLGTESHHKELLPDVMNLKIPGCFAMTETGHGSDVANIGTTATYDEDTKEFVIHTPSRHAWKDYIGNAALHGKAAVVFAQLITKGENHGVHAFYVPLRDESGNFLAGVGGDDDGIKGGLNGIDNGRLHFANVRIPRTWLLNRYGSVSEDGSYSSPIESKGRRFFTMLGTLVQGRVSITGGVTNAQKIALTIAIRYANERRQFPSQTGEEHVLMDYGRHQRRLLPALARTYAQAFGHLELLEQFDEVFSGRNDTDATRADLETVAAAAKALSTWNALEIIQISREACGGQGFMSEHRMTGLRADLDVYATFEGDNNVLLQLVAKRLLSDYSKAFASPDFGTLAQYVVEQVGEVALNRGGLRALAQKFTDFGSTARSIGFVREDEHQHQLLTDRVHTMIARLANELKHSSKKDPAEAERLFNRHQNDLIMAAKAHGELIQWEAFTSALNKIENPETKKVMTWLRDLFGFTLLEENLAWYMVNGRLNSQRAEAITDYIDGRLLPRLRPHSLDLVDSFGLTEGLIRSDLAFGAETRRRENLKKAEAK
jgi:acyl-CoA oxidase